MSPDSIAQARDASTPADVLRRLSRGGDPLVLASVVANPNAPPDVLWALADRFPRELFLNPSLELLSLEDPLWLERFPARVVARLMSHPDVPEWFIAQVFAGPPAVRREVAVRIRRPDLMWRLAQKAASDPKLLESLLSNATIPIALLEHLAVEHGLLGRVLLHGKLRPHYFVDAALAAGHFESPEGARELARLSRLKLSAPQLERMVASPHEPVRWAVAHSPLLSEELLLRLARDPSLRVRAQVAFHPRCPPLLARAIRQVLPLHPRPSPLEP